MRRWLASSSPYLGESHLLWDYLDFCLGGRKGPSVYMPFSPGRIRRQSHSLSLTLDEEENLAEVIREIQKVFPIPKREAVGSRSEAVASRPPRRLAVDEAKAVEGAHCCLKRRGWAYSMQGCQLAPGTGRSSTATWELALAHTLSRHVSWGNISGGKFCHRNLKGTFPLTHS